ERVAVPLNTALRYLAAGIQAQRVRADGALVGVSGADVERDPGTFGELRQALWGGKVEVPLESPEQPADDRLEPHDLGQQGHSFLLVAVDVSSKQDLVI